MAASLDHALWFHRPFRADDWLLYAQDSPNLSGSRGFSRGLIFARDGTLVASVAQEGLLRQRRTDPAWTGRAFAVSMSFNYLGFPIGSALAGVIAARSIEAALACSATACLVAATVAIGMIPSRQDQPGVGL